jgi:hypothetical protein
MIATVESRDVTVSFARLYDCDRLLGKFCWVGIWISIDILFYLKFDEGVNVFSHRSISFIVNKVSHRRGILGKSFNAKCRFSVRHYMKLFRTENQSSRYKPVNSILRRGARSDGCPVGR